ncbi:histone chaperone ASF1-like [Salvia miltiorrhiza]|uniref:histone chaperone ASF1-like n=1 Tax=Salvia miltiorrhiza TaxID=226208 RepID=UPI0025AD07C4|nr:histone chaperone ASF1-like [Salvia miltiorrhiza]
MAFLALSILPASTPASPPFFPTPSTPFKPSSSSLLPPSNCFRRIPALRSTSGRRRSFVVGMAPDEEKMTRRSPLDFPIEWDRPKPGRRPDIFPQFSPMKTPLPPPMPADPPEEDEEDEEQKKEEEEENEEENPDKEDK